jgi:hypothetical protein
VDSSGTAKMVGELVDRVARDKEGDSYGYVKRVCRRQSAQHSEVKSEVVREGRVTGRVTGRSHGLISVSGAEVRKGRAARARGSRS